MKSENLTAIVDFIYLGEANVFPEKLENFLALAEEFQLKGLEGSCNEEQNSEYPMESSTHGRGRTDLNQKQSITDGSVENVKSEETSIKIEPKLRNAAFNVQHPRMGSLIEPDTMKQ